MTDDQRGFATYGESSAEPDHRVRGDDNSHDEDSLGREGRYPGSESGRPEECRSCGATISTDVNRQLCENCLGADVEVFDTDVDLADTVDWQIQQLQFAVVPAESAHIAAAKGTVEIGRAVGLTPGVGEQCRSTTSTPWCLTSSSNAGVGTSRE